MIASVFIAFESWRIFKANERLKYFILAEMRPLLGDTLHIERVHVGFGNIHMYNVSFTVPGQYITTTIKDLRVGYNFLNLLVRGFHPQLISQDVLLVEPEITIGPQALSRSDSAHHNNVSKAAPRFLSAQLKELDLLNYISLKRGRVIFQQNDSTAVTLTHSVQGGIFRQSGDSLFINLIGSFLESQESNMTISGNADLNAGRLTRLDARLTHYDAENGIPFLNKEIVDLRRGVFQGNFHVFQNRDRRTFRLTGEGFLQQGEAELFAGQLNVEQLNAALTLSQDSLRIQSSDMLLNNSPVTVSGTIQNVKTPFVDVHLVSDELALTSFSKVLGPSLQDRLRGQAVVRTHVTGPVHNLSLVNNVWVKRLHIDDFEVQNVQSAFTYRQGRLYIQRANAEILNVAVQMKGQMDTRTPGVPLKGQLFAEINDISALVPLPIDSSLTGSTVLNGDISGTLNEPLIAGQWNTTFTDAQSDTFFLNSSVSVQNKRLRLATTPETEPFRMEALLDFNRSPAGIQVEIEQVEHLSAFFWTLPYEDMLLRQVNGHLSMDGSLHHLNIWGAFERLSGGINEGEFLRFDANLNHHNERVWSNASFVINPQHSRALQGSIEIEKTNERFSLKSFNINGEFSSSWEMDYSDSTITGQAEANRLDLARLTAGMIPSLQGWVDADVSFGGTTNEPTLHGNLRANRLSYNELGPYEIVTDFSYDSTQFNLQDFLLNFNATTLLFAEGNYNTNYDTLDLSVKGAGFDVGTVYRVTGRDTLLTGEALVNLDVSGHLRSPQIQGVLAIQDGKFLNVPFDEMELLLGRQVPITSEPDVPRLWIEKFRLTRFNEFEFLTRGYFPFHQNDSLYLDIDGVGNFLAILSDIENYFRQPESFCTLTGRVRGTPLNPVLQEAHVVIKDASMEFGSVVPPISDVDGELHLNLEDQFVDLTYLRGKMGGKPFNIYNERVQNITSARPLQDIRLPDNSLNFGVLVLETPKKGVPLSFVGLMEPNEYGHLELLGRESDEKFYFAALEEGLTLRGRINLYESEIMYPFYENASGTSPKVKEFLENLHWDLMVVPVKNTRFVRNFPGAIDEVYVDLKLDERYGGLEFSDRLADDTFRINGTVRSTKGMIEYLDMTFRVEHAGVEFDRSSLIPVAYGQARTTVTDSLGISSNILLTLQTVDNTMDKKSVDDIVRQEEGRARFNQIRFKLSSDNPNIGSSEAQIMASLGYSANNFQNSALEAIGYGTDNLILRPLFRPVERELEQAFGFDYVRFSSQLTRNIIQFNLNNNIDLNNRLALLESTKIIVGKYLANRFFIQYTGQLESGVGYRYKEKDLGLHHTVGLEYQINPQLLVELEYDYDSLMLYNRDDKRIVLRHWFPF